MECCGFPMKTKIKKNGQKVAKCRRCGDVKKIEKGSVGPGLWASVEQAKAEYEEALKKALTAKYDVLFNYKPSDPKVEALTLSCLALKKKYEQLRGEFAATTERLKPDTKVLGKPGKTLVAYETRREFEEKLWKFKYKIPDGPRPPLEKVWWFDGVY